jgi:hypothetical protein
VATAQTNPTDFAPAHNSGRVNVAGDERPRVIADICSYEEMIAALRQRVSELQIHGQRFDDFAGLPIGYLSKLIGPNPVRRIGMQSFAPLLTGLGLRLLVIEDPQATARLKSRVVPRNQSYARRVSLYVNGLTDRKWARIQKIGRQARWEKLSKKERSAIMRAVRAGGR